MIYLTMFLAQFSYVMLRAFQQRNVAFDNFWWIVPTSYGMAAIDIFIVASVAKQGWSLPLVFWVGTAGASGAMSAMLFHKRFVMRKSK